VAIPPISITGFSGEIPVADARLLPEQAASDSVNAWLFSGRVEPVHSLQPVHIMSKPSMRSWFRMPKGSPSIDNMVDSYWMEFENENVRVVRSPVVGQDDDGRFYWADGLYPKYVTGDMIKAALGPTPPTLPTQPVPWKLGVPSPLVAAAVVPSGGVSSTLKTVQYTYTWVTGYGEEGPPAPPSVPPIVGNKIDATYTLTLTGPLPADTTSRNLTKTRIYRTVVSTQGVAVYFFVAEIPIAQLTYADNNAGMTDAIIVNNEQLPSLTWSGPPPDLQGLVILGNGMIAGWRFNEVWFCEPYKPHAWPIQYVIAVDANVVGLGVHEQSLIILTSGHPYAATGVVPEAMALSKIQPLEPCTSRRSIVNTPQGVLYCSPNGLINVTARGTENLTREHMLKDQWDAKLNLGSVIATTLANGYYCFSGPTEGVFQKDAFQHFIAGGGTSLPPPPNPTADTPDAFQLVSAFGTRPGMFMHRTLGITVLDPSPSEVFNLIQDLYNGETLQLRDGVIHIVDLRRTAPYAKYRWKSKMFTLPYLQNLGAAKVYWTPKDHDAPDEASYFRVYAGAQAELTDDGLPLKFQQAMTKSGQMFRLPSGFKAQYYQFEVEGYLIVDAIHCAQTARELRKV